MNDINRKTCRFCLKILYSNEFCPIEETTRHMLEALLNLNLDVDNGTEMCIECARNLRNAYDFKSTCVDIEKRILPLLIAKENMMLNKDSLKQNRNAELLNACEDQKICRFCLKMTERERYTILQEKEHIFILDVIQKYIPELHLSDTEEIITCEVCLISLQSLLTFITGCLNMGEESENMDETVKSQLKLIDIKAIDSKHEVGDDNITMEENYIVKSEDVTELGNPELLIKNEETESFHGTAFSSNLNLMNMKICKGTPKEHEQTSQSISKVEAYSCERCSFGPNNKDKSTQYTIHENDSEKMYKCKTCLHLLKCESSPKRYMLIRKDFSAVPVYKCKTCSYQTKLKANLKKHMLIHQNVSDVTVYKCKTCAHLTKSKSNLKRHMLIHQDFPAVPVYKCEMCSYRTKLEDNLTKHMLIHKNGSNLTVYKCGTCSFQTKYKNSLKSHLLIHQDPLKVMMYKCETCSYQTKFKQTLKRHMLIHENLSDIIVYKCETEKTYKCNTCSHLLKCESSLKRHMLIHQDYSAVPVYKCETCSYQTKLKGNLKIHMLIHQDVAEVTIYKCETCSFQTKFKNNLKMHLLIHQDPSEVVIYKCETCSYQTKFKQTLKRHVLIHKKLSDITVYKYETKNIEM